MYKKFATVLCAAAIVGLFFCSCSDFYPKRVEIQGTFDFPIRIGVNNWGTAFGDIIKKAFISNTGEQDFLDFDVEIFNVNHGQEEQIFCIYISSEMINPLNPDDYLQQVSEFLYKKDSNDIYKISHSIDAVFLRDIEVDDLTIRQNIPLLSSGTTLPPIVFDLATPYEISLGADAGFVCAEIAAGNITIAMKLLNGDTILDESLIEKTYNIEILQNDYSYDNKDYKGLSCSVGPSNSKNLNAQSINNNSIAITGSVTLKSKPGTTLSFSYDELTARLEIKIGIEKLTSMDWEFNTISDDFHQIDPIPLEQISTYVNYIAYEKKGIGIQFHFDEMLANLEMALVCKELGLNDKVFKKLEKGEDIKFANKSAGTLWLAGTDPQFHASEPAPPFTNEPAKSLTFELALRPEGGGSVLHISPDGGISPDVPLKIEGRASFVQNWLKAEINMENAIKTAGTDAGIGQIPSAGEDPIDLSMLNKYLSGFTFDDHLSAKIYLSGPFKVFENEKPGLDFWAEHDNGTIPIYQEHWLELDEEPVVIGSDVLENGSYISDELPKGGNTFDFLDIINDRPKSLVFQYRVELPSTITVTPDMFESGGKTINSNVVVTIMIMLPLKLTGPGEIKFPDMFNDGRDLFGRNPDKDDSSKPEANSLLSSLDLDYLRFSINFTEAFFNGGQLNIAKDRTGNNIDALSNGIRINGNGIVLDISPEVFETVRNTFIVPNISLSFKEEGGVTIPRNMGITSVRLEAKGKGNLEF